MHEAVFDCDCDSVIEMERRGVGVEEILQYARSVLSYRDVLALLGHLEGFLESRERVGRRVNRNAG